MSELINLYNPLLPSPEIIKKHRLSTVIGIFLVTILAYIWNVWKGSQYANEYCCKIFAEWLLMSTGMHRNIGVHWYEKGYVSSKYSYLYFIQFSLFDFSSTKTTFSFRPLWKANVDCVSLASTMNWIWSWCSHFF